MSAIRVLELFSIWNFAKLDPGVTVPSEKFPGVPPPGTADVPTSSVLPKLEMEYDWALAMPNDAAIMDAQMRPVFFLW